MGAERNRWRLPVGYVIGFASGYFAVAGPGWAFLALSLLWLGVALQWGPTSDDDPRAMRADKPNRPVRER